MDVFMCSLILAPTEDYKSENCMNQIHFLSLQFCRCMKNILGSQRTGTCRRSALSASSQTQNTLLTCEQCLKATPAVASRCWCTRPGWVTGTQGRIIRNVMFYEFNVSHALITLIIIVTVLDSSLLRSMSCLVTRWNMMHRPDS